MARLAGNVGLAEIVHHQFIRAAETPRKRLRIRADETHVWVGRLSGYRRCARCRYPYKYFLKVLAVTARLSANSVANGSTMKVGCRLNGSAR